MSFDGFYSSRFQSWFDFSTLSKEGGDEAIIAQEREQHVISMLHQVCIQFTPPPPIFYYLYTFHSDLQIIFLMFSLCHSWSPIKQEIWL